MHKRMQAFAVSILLPILAVVGGWGIHLGTSRNVMAVGKDAALRHYKVPEVSSLEEATKPSITLASNVTALDEKSHPGIDPAVEAFLSIHQLDRYADEFQRALKTESLDLLARRIFSESGYQLVQLPSLPDRIRRKYGALAFTLRSGKPPVWLLFWRPQLTLKRFYFQYQGDEIRQLQSLFAGLKLYPNEIDGIVGEKVMRALVDFQKISALPVTGFPDTATLFLLHHYSKDEASWPKA